MGQFLNEYFFAEIPKTNIIRAKNFHNFVKQAKKCNISLTLKNMAKEFGLCQSVSKTLRIWPFNWPKGNRVLHCKFFSINPGVK